MLVDLARFCEAGSGLNNMPLIKQTEKPAAGESDPVMFRRSYGKVCDMLDAVRRDQYVSFIQ